MNKLMIGMVLAALAAGCSTDKIHEWTREDPVPLEKRRHPFRPFAPAFQHVDDQLRIYQILHCIDIIA